MTAVPAEGVILKRVVDATHSISPEGLSRHAYSRFDAAQMKTASDAITVYRGSCDASAAVRIGADSKFVTASDEDYILRVYSSRQPGLPSLSLDLTTFLESDDATKEPDIEGAARIRDRVYWITSHGRDSDG